MRVTFRLLPLLFCALSTAGGEFARLGHFGDSPQESRILKIIHGWPDQPEAQDALIERLKGEGFGGVVCNVSSDHYLESEAKWGAFSRAVSEAKKAGMALWLYDERGYPSGNAGGLVLQAHPEWEARGLLIANQEYQAGPVELAVPPGRPFLTAAFPTHNGQLDLSGKIDLSAQIAEGKLKWHAPAGRWHVMAITEDVLYAGTHAEGNYAQKMPYINLLQPEPTARFLEVTHQRYTDTLGPDLGKYFDATFTDEPSLMSCFLRPMPYRPLPWAPNLPVEFKRRRGYALDTTVVPSLIADTGPGCARHRYDFWLTVGELVSENYFGQIQTWCRQHNVPSGGHLLMEEGLVTHVPFYGDFFRCARRLDAPSIDCLTSLPPEVPWYIARLLASAAELERRPVVMCETSDHGQVYRPAGDKRPKRIVTEAEIRGTCNRLIVAGINRITSYYSFGGLDSTQLRRLNKWVGACCSSLLGGHQVADIALVYPTESLWTKFTPARHWASEAPAASRIETLYRAAMESLFAAQREFTVVDSRTLAQAKVERGALVHGLLRWRVIVLPGVDTLPWAAWENLARFARGGGVVIALGSRPANTESEFPSQRVTALADKMFGPSESASRPGMKAGAGGGLFLRQGSEGLLPMALSSVLDPDVQISGLDSPLRSTHRHIDDKQVYFVINDSPKPWSGSVRFSAAGQGEVWDPASGRLAQKTDSSMAELSLEPYGAVLVQFPVARQPRLRHFGPGPLPNLISRSLLAVEPTVPHGEFVRAVVAPDTAHSSAQSPAWQATATITKSQVDTFLFLEFRFPELLDLSDTECLSLDTWVPDGQSTPSQVLVILQEEGGEDYLANTGRSLAAPGHELSYLPLRQFQRAGWSQPGDGVLDLKKVRAIRIGWGGYLGTEAETVRFSTALPKLVRVMNRGPSPTGH